MIKIPVKHKRSIETELKRFLPVFSSLAAKGKASSEDDARIILNDVLSYVLGYDKYNELKTEQRDKGGRLDYSVTLMDGPKRRRNKPDFIVEAKAAHLELNQNHVDQTLAYSLTAGLDFFVLTNVLKWQLYKVKRSRKAPEAILIHEVSFNMDNSAESLAEDFYVFSKASFLADDWQTISMQAKATNESDIAAILLSDKMVRRVVKQLEDTHGTRVDDEIVKDIIENKLFKAECADINKSLLRKLNTKPVRTAGQSASASKPEKSEVGDISQTKSEQVCTLDPTGETSISEKHTA